MTLKEMHQKAKSMGLRGFWKMKKSELEDLIEERSLHNSEILFIGQCSGNGEWLKHRRIGATDTAILVVDNAYRQKLVDRPDKYTSPYLMYMEKKGNYEREISFNSKVAMDYGHFAEDFMISYIPQLFEKEFGIKIEDKDIKKGKQVVMNKEYPLWSCTPDSWVKINEEWYPVELKTGNSHTAYEWTNETVPDKYFSQVQQQLAVLGKTKGFIFGFVDNKFTKVYEVKRDDKLIKQAYEITKQFQYCLDNNIEPELNGCEAECEYLKQEFKGFGNKYENIPGMDINEKDLQYYLDLEQTKREISKETKEIEKDMKTLICVIQNKMLDLETENLVINGSYLATWKIDARGAKRFALKELKENQKIKEVAS